MEEDAAEVVVVIVVGVGVAAAGTVVVAFAFGHVVSFEMKKLAAVAAVEVNLVHTKDYVKHL